MNGTAAVTAGHEGNAKKYYIGIDMGTTHIKTAVFTEAGREVKLIKRQTPVRQDAYGSVYDPEEFFQIAVQELNEGLEALPADCLTAGISVTGMAEAGLIIDRRTGKEAGPILPWFDKRTGDLAADLSTEEADRAFLVTGLRNSFKYGIYKFRWMLSNTGIDKENAVWLSVCDYIVYRLTGRMVTVPGFAARTFMYDIVRGCYRTDALQRYGLSGQNFPEVLPSGIAAGIVRAGEVHAKGRKLLAAIAGHDHVCAAYAVQGGDGTRICNSAGTAETYIGSKPAGRLKREDMDSGLIIGPHVDGKSLFWLANISSSGQSVEWFRKNLQLSEISYERLNEAVLEAGSGPTGILYYPYLSGMGTPLFNPDLSGAFLGLKAEHTYKDLLKAVMEGLGFQSRYILKDVLKQDSVLVCVGGAARSAPWMQIKADILGRDILVPDITEATLLGAAALFAAVNDGKEAGRVMLADVYAEAKRYAPVPEQSRAYEKEFLRFLKGMRLIEEIDENI